MQRNFDDQADCETHHLDQWTLWTFRNCVPWMGDWAYSLTNIILEIKVLSLRTTRAWRIVALCSAWSCMQFEGRQKLCVLGTNRLTLLQSITFGLRAVDDELSVQNLHSTMWRNHYRVIIVFERKTQLALFCLFSSQLEQKRLFVKLVNFSLLINKNEDLSPCSCCNALGSAFVRSFTFVTTRC